MDIGTLTLYIYSVSVKSKASVFSLIPFPLPFRLRFILLSSICERARTKKYLNLNALFCLV